MTSTLERYLAQHGRKLVAESPEHCLELLSTEFAHGFYYRGMTNLEYEILSSMDRCHASSEHYKYVGERAFHFREQWYYREFKSVAHNHIAASSLPTTLFEWFALMQHHGVPTRLIDLTRSPYVALYFAVRDWTSECDAVLWAVGEEKLHRSSYMRLQEVGFPFPINDPAEYANEMQEFLRDEWFGEAFLSGNYRVAMILSPQWTSVRLAAQQGAFLVCTDVGTGKEELLMDLIADNSCLSDDERMLLEEGHKFDISLRKLVIPANQKKQLMRHLQRMNLSASTLFPGIEGTALGITERGFLENWASGMTSWQ